MRDREECLWALLIAETERHGGVPSERQRGVPMGFIKTSD